MQPALACLTALRCFNLVFLFFFAFTHIGPECYVDVLMIISQMSTAVTVSVKMEEPVRWAYSCFIWHYFL